MTDLSHFEPGSLVPEQRATQAYIHAASSDNTRRAYRSDLAHFQAWGGLLPARPHQILQYLTHYAAELNARTLMRRLIALRHWHTYQGLADPTQTPELQKCIKGIQRIHGQAPKRARALQLPELTQIVAALQTDNLSDVRDSALLQIGFFGAFRRSELVQIDYEHLQFAAEGLIVFIPRSKTDPYRRGHTCRILENEAKQALCPVRALRKWLTLAHIESGPLFRGTSQGRVMPKRLSEIMVNRVLRRSAEKAGLTECAAFSGHSLRRGLATASSEKDVPLQNIMRQGRWRSHASVLAYINEQQSFEQNLMHTLYKV